MNPKRETERVIRCFAGGDIAESMVDLVEDIWDSHRQYPEVYQNLKKKKRKTWSKSVLPDNKKDRVRFRQFMSVSFLVFFTRIYFLRIPPQIYSRAIDLRRHTQKDIRERARERVLNLEAKIRRELGLDPRDDGIWWEHAQEQLNLSASPHDLEQVQKQVEEKIKKLYTPKSPQDIAEKARIYTRAISLANLVEDAGRSGVIFHPKTKLSRDKLFKTKNFLLITKLDVLLSELGLKTSTDRRMYVAGVLERFGQRSSHLGSLCSPSSFYTYLHFLRFNWGKGHEAGTRDTAGKKQLRYEGDYYKQCRRDAVGLAKKLIRDNNGSSRIVAEFPEALGPHDMMVFYCLSSGLILKLYDLKILKKGWVDTHKKIRKLLAEAEINLELQETLSETRREIDKLWKKAGVPHVKRNDYKQLKPFLDTVSVKRKKGLREWVLASTTKATK